MRALVVFAFLAAATGAVAQPTYLYEGGLENLAQGINSSLAGTENRTVLVASFRRLDGRGCNVDEAITGDFEEVFSRQSKTYKLLNRTALQEYAKEHKLQMEGLMNDTVKMKEAGRLLKADIMVFGTYRFVDKILVLRVHADDIQTSEQLEILSVNCRPSRILEQLCEEADSSPTAHVDRTSSGTAGRESAESASTVPCGSQTGTFCFKNSGTHDIRVTLPNLEPTRQGGYAVGTTIIVPAGGQECLYDKPSGVYAYEIRGPRANAIMRQASIRIEPCKSGEYSYPTGSDARSSSGAPVTAPAEPCGSQTGSYCFSNNGKEAIIVGSSKFRQADGPWYKPLTVQPGRTECFYERPVGAFDYQISLRHQRPSAQGSLRIEPCKTQTYSYP